MVAATGCKKKPAGDTTIVVSSDETSSDMLAMRDSDDDVDLDGVEPVEGNGGTETSPGEAGSAPAEKPATQQGSGSGTATKPATTQAAPPAQSSSGSGSQANANSPAGTYNAQVSNEFRNTVREGLRQQGGSQMTEEMMAQMMAMAEQQISGMKLTLNPGGDFIFNLGMAGEIKGNWTVSGDKVSLIAKSFVDRSTGTPVEQQATREQQEPQIAKWNKSAGTLTVDQGGMELTFKKA